MKLIITIIVAFAITSPILAKDRGSLKVAPESEETISSDIQTPASKSNEKSLVESPAAIEINKIAVKKFSDMLRRRTLALHAAMNDKRKSRLEIEAAKQQIIKSYLKEEIALRRQLLSDLQSLRDSSHRSH